MTPTVARALAVFGNRSGGKLKRLADSEISDLSQRVRRSDASLVEPAIFGRRDAGGRLESAIEGPERLKARIHRNGDHGHLGLRGVRQSGLRLLDSVIVEEDIEIAVTELLVDQAPQFVLGHRELCCQRSDGHALMAIDAVAGHQTHQRIEQLAIGSALLVGSDGRGSWSL